MKNKSGKEIDWSRQVPAAVSAKLSIAPNSVLPVSNSNPFSETRIQVANETTFGAARRLFDTGLNPLALNFANGVTPAVGFLFGAMAHSAMIRFAQQLIFDRPWRTSFVAFFPTSYLPSLTGRQKNFTLGRSVTFSRVNKEYKSRANYPAARRRGTVETGGALRTPSISWTGPRFPLPAVWV